MALVRVTQSTVKEKLVEWKKGTNIENELIFLPTDIQYTDIQALAFEQGILIDVQPCYGVFYKFIFISMV